VCLDWSICTWKINIITGLKTNCEGNPGLDSCVSRDGQLVGSCKHVTGKSRAMKSDDCDLKGEY